MSMLLWAPAYSQDDIKSVELKINDPSPVNVELSTCRLSLTATDYGGSSTTISVDVENTTDANPIFLFGHAFTEKDLKKQNILFDKKSYGSTSRELLICEGLDGDNILRIEPGGNRVLTIENIGENSKKIEIPLYLAKLEKKKPIGKEKYSIKQRAKIILNVRLIAEDKTDKTFENIKSKCDELIADIEKNPVCPNKNHPVSRQKQIDDINSRIIDLKDEIFDIKSEHRWKERDEAYKPYKELLATLDNIEIKEATCPKCQRDRKSPTRQSAAHSCGYCSKSPTSVLVELQRIYQKLDNRLINKQGAIRAVEGAHRAWTGGCLNLKKKMAEDTVTKGKVEKYYNSIVNY